MSLFHESGISGLPEHSRALRIRRTAAVSLWGAMMKLMSVAGLCVVVACCVGTLASAQERGGSRRAQDRGRAEQSERSQDRENDRGSYFERHGYARLNIPKGHYPPPGECVPPGAWVIRHPDDDPEHVHVVVYDEQRPGSVLVVGEFNIASGVFVRIVVDR